MISETFRKRKALRRYARFSEPVATVEACAIVQDGKFVVSFGNQSFFVDPGETMRRAPEIWNFALFGLAAISMSQNIAIKFDGPVSESGAAAIEQLRQNFETWNILTLAPLRLEISNTVADETNKGNSASVICLSGGIDSTAAAIAAKELHGFDYGMLIAGADYPNSKAPGFIELESRVARIAERLGFGLRVSETSIRRIDFHWESLFSLNLAMCLHALGNGFRAGAIGADYTLAQDLVGFPWGGSHAMHSCFGTASFPILSLNEQTGRTEKLRNIVSYDPGLIEHLSVCWSDTTSGGNCGFCPKCQRTKLNFLGAIGEIPDIFRENAPLDNYVRGLKVPKQFTKIRIELVMAADIYQNLPDGETKDLTGIYLENLKIAHARGMPLP